MPRNPAYLFGLALIPLALASLLVGAAGLGTGALGGAEGWLVLTQSRWPRTLAVILTGAALSVAGVVMQQLVRNRFVEPGTTGTAEGAALGLLAVNAGAPGAPIWMQMLAASAAALASTWLFLRLVRRLPPREVLLVPLVGMILAGILQAVVTFVGWETDLLQFVSVWLMSGEFSGVIAGRYELLWVAGAAAVLAFLAADRFAILGLGEDRATSLGLKPEAVMRLGLVVVAVVTAMVVATVGMVPFVGLVVPNITQRLMGDNLRRSLPATALGGAALVLACDLLGRLVRYPYELPVGSVLGVLGAGIFLWLLWRRPGHVRRAG
ncbi:ABC transporter permease [Frigidibacter sp. MR17.24]|uniref:ABC transporter permease n=1 Tax=Frigidibacter sp. MR17.24 TaxID=3127345 RepID=UPI003012AE8F